MKTLIQISGLDKPQEVDGFNVGQIDVHWTPTCFRLHSPIWGGKYNKQTKALARPWSYIYSLQDKVGTAYIGETLHPLNRFSRHIGEVTQRLVYYNGKLTRKELWLADLLKRGVLPELHVLEEVCYEDRLIAEKEWCQLYREHGWQLVNSSTGPRRKHDPDSIELMRRVQKERNDALGEEGRKAVADWCRGKPLSEDHKAKLREGAKQRPPVSDKTRRLMSEARKGQKRTEQAKANMREAQRKRRAKEREERQGGESGTTA